MGGETTLARLRQGGLVVVARRLPVEHVFPVARALIEAGVPAFEITLDEPSAVTTIAELRKRFGDELLIGAGTTLYPADASAALAVGAHFVVSPVFVPEVLDVCDKADVLCIPGAMAPADIFDALTAGAKVVKLFPASIMTPAYIHDVLQPFHALNPVFMLTGGLDDQQIPDYLAAGVSIVGVGGAILDAEALATHHYERITARARDVLKAIQEGD